MRAYYVNPITWGVIWRARGPPNELEAVVVVPGMVIGGAIGYSLGVYIDYAFSLKRHKLLNIALGMLYASMGVFIRRVRRRTIPDEEWNQGYPLD